ncbi:MAG: radical SAM/SPASM domain-containing protein [Gammaproteobacteria bacterium]
MIEISNLWNRAHRHLRPMSTRLPLDQAQNQHCSVCSQAGAFRIVAHVRFGENHWQENTQILYCGQCDKWFLPEDQFPRVDNGQVISMPPTAVNGRLWSRSPTFLNIEPTTRCNFSCWYCVGRHMEQKDITTENFRQVLDNFPTVKTLALVGEGEPLMHKGFFKMARMAADRDIRVVMVSNGSTFSTSNVKKICESGIVYVSVSIDSYDASTFAESRIGGDLDQVLAGIRRLAAYRDNHGFRYPRIGLKGTLFGQTQDQLPGIVALAKSYGVEIFESFQPLNPMSTYLPIYPDEKLKTLTTDEQTQVASAIHRDTAKALTQLKSIQRFCEEEGIAVSNSGRPNLLRPNCDEEWIYALLSGNVTPCCQIKTPISPNWNLVNHSIDEILADELYENTRFNLWNGLFPDYCKGCYKTNG